MATMAVEDDADVLGEPIAVQTGEQVPLIEAIEEAELHVGLSSYKGGEITESSVRITHLPAVLLYAIPTMV
jgi:hypothetical protein